MPELETKQKEHNRLPKYAARAIWQNKPTSATPVNILIDPKSMEQKLVRNPAWAQCVG